MGKKLSDRIPYLEKRDKLEVSVGSVYNCQSNCYVVALSRRAPRFLEKIFDTEERAHQEREELNTVTELALPFLYHQQVTRYKCQKDTIIYQEKENLFFEQSCH